jgi:hypothetical protein
MYPPNRNNPNILISLPRVDTVFAIGEFNGWSTVATPLKQIDNDQWELQEPPRNVKLDRLAFFVVPQGRRTGRVINYRDLAPV